ncbi:hypothetical protein J0H58_23020 [bacterium]|nr:hypothetical protein [bacterium]
MSFADSAGTPTNPVVETYQRIWPMLALLSARKQVLVYVAFVRRFASLFTDDACHQLITAAEQVADGELELRALTTQKNECLKRLHANPAELPNRMADYAACELGFYATHRSRELSGLARRDRLRTAAGDMLLTMLYWHQFICPVHPEQRDEWLDTEVQAFLEVGRDVGDVAAVRLDPRWVSDDVARLATVAYDSRDFSRLPEIADALDDAGCGQPDILAHCRGPGPHVRGCWVVDLVLGKA